MARKKQKKQKSTQGMDALGVLLTPEELAKQKSEKAAKFKKTMNKQTIESSRSARRPQFHNPYNFIPVLPRGQVTGEIGDRLPTGHSHYASGTISGRLSLTLTTKTPLLLPDAAKAKDVGPKGHKSFPLRKADGRPYLAPTSIKGMLRSAYEAVTNSRLAIFQDHESCLAYRMDARDGLSLVPARIGKDGKVIELMLGFTEGLPSFGSNGNWHIPDKTMYAAWIQRYENKTAKTLGKAENTSVYTEKDHGKEFKARIQKIEHYRWYKESNKYSEKPDFYYWKVCQNGLVSEGKSLDGVKLRATKDSGKHRPTKEYKDVTGYLCLTGKNIGNKYNERLFFIDSKNEIKSRSKVRPNEETLARLRREWKQLIENYQQEHKAELDKGESGPPQARNGAVWSYHITGARGRSQATEAMLKEGTLCYAKVDKVGNEFKIESLYPVMIARKLFGKAPDALLSKSLKPANSLEKLSPADRVFGWANQSGNGAYKGQLRIHSIECEKFELTEHTISKHPDGLAMSILGQPKPSQTRFYTAADKNGTPLEGVRKKKGYQEDHGLRGRKVYPHHRQRNEYWNTDMERREYARPEQERDSQNRSIQEWVDPGAKFTFQIDLMNLSEVEIGALLWLLTLPSEHYHRLGGGRPYGFGSITLEVNWDKSNLRSGDQWQQYYSVLNSSDTSSVLLEEKAKEWSDIFEQELQNAYGQHQILASFKRMAEGFLEEKPLPIHYPRNHEVATAKDENFNWFKDNEDSEKLALPLLVNDRGLPRFFTSNKSKHKSQSGTRRTQQPQNSSRSNSHRNADGSAPKPKLRNS